MEKGWLTRAGQAAMERLDLPGDIQPGVPRMELVGDREFFGIIGHTGSGKSTVAQMLNGLLRPSSGDIKIYGRKMWEDPKKIKEFRYITGLVFQYPEYQLFEETVAKDIAFGPTNMGKSGAELEKAVIDAARFTGLKDELLE